VAEKKKKKGLQYLSETRDMLSSAFLKPTASVYSALESFERAKLQRGATQDWEQDWSVEGSKNEPEEVPIYRRPEAIREWKNCDLYNALHLPRMFSGGSTRVRASYHKMAMVSVA
jgi:hypothetical protein